MQILASGKVGSQRYANNDIAKPVPALDMIELGQQTQRALEETQGYSLSNEEGSSASQNEDLSIIDTSNISDYDDTLAKLIQTYVANNSYLDVDPSSTANNIILVPRKIANINSPDGTNYSKLTSLPFNFRDNLTFTFRAKDTNTNAVTISIPALAGLSGSIALIDEQGAALSGNAIIANKYYTITTATVSTVKKAILRAAITSATETVAGIARIATQSETNSLINDTTTITPKKLGNGFSLSATTNGYIKLPSWLGGFTIQWGSATTGTTVTFPAEFTTLFAVNITLSSNAAVKIVAIEAASKTTFQAQSWNNNGTGSSGDPVYWTAFGKI